MINVATVGVHIHKAARLNSPIRFWGKSSILSNKASPTAMTSTSTEKMAALVVSVSLVNIPQPPSLAEEPARRSYLAAGRWPGSGPRSRRGAGSDPALSRDVKVPRNECSILLESNALISEVFQRTSENSPFETVRKGVRAALRW